MGNEYFDFIQQAFTDGFAIDLHFEDDPKEISHITFRNKTISTLKVRSGKIGACDPFEPMAIMPFDQDFPKGDFPVQLSLSSLEDDERVAFARVVFSSSPTSRWELATKSDSEEEEEAYIVESGSGSFFDIDAGMKFVELGTANDDWFDDVEELMNENYAHTRSWHTVELDGLNVVLFSAGEGDGYFKTFIGYDAQGKPTQLVTDFKMLLPDGEEE